MSSIECTRQIKGTLIGEEQGLIRVTISDSEYLWSLGYYGTSPFRHPQKQNPLFSLLSIWEAFYLMTQPHDNVSFTLVNAEDGNSPLSSEMVIEIAKKNSFHLHLIAYCELRRLGWFIQGGLNFGVDFLLYRRGPEKEHAPYAVIVKSRVKDEVRWKDIISINRVATTAKKRLIIAFVEENLKVSYLYLSRWTPESERNLHNQNN